MSITPRPPIPSLIPESAPFTPEQRTWLNGLFAGMISLEESVTPLSDEQAAKLLPDLLDRGAPAEADDGAPWHDPAMPLPDRMKLAEGKPLPRRMMAAMAQQDCSQCGYNCKDYADALFAKKEERLNLCVPGGKDTARMLKNLYAELGVAPPRRRPTPRRRRPQRCPRPAARATIRSTPPSCRAAASTSRARKRKPGISNSISPNAGSTMWSATASASIPPTMPRWSKRCSPRSTRRRIFRSADAPCARRSPTAYRCRPRRTCCSSSFPISPAASAGRRRRRWRPGGDPDGDAATLDVLAALQKFPGIRPDPEAFIESLDALQPRVYSISSSLKCNPGRVSLTVDAVRYEVEKRTRLGVASTFLAGRVSPGDKIRVYVQKAQHFALPADPKVPIIMIGPGTGLAPFRAFLQERQATKAPGRNWLFFGHQRSNYDFFYEDELVAMRSAGLLTRLTLAWSRDGEEKIYVQHRMREVGRDLWAWLADGAHVYVCGDAQRMAKDVERALVDVIAEHGARTPAEAAAFLAEMKKQDRYQADVY